jgi:hypothetical protein
VVLPDYDTRFPTKNISRCTFLQNSIETRRRESSRHPGLLIQ